MLRRLIPLSPALVALISIAVVGCGGVNPLDDGRLEVNDHLRVACAGYAETDADIEMLLTLVEADRVNGAPWPQETANVMTVCSNSDWPAELRVRCADCGTAVTNQVYGRD